MTDLDNRTHILRAETVALRKLAEGYSLDQVADSTGLPRARLIELCRDFPGSTTTRPRTTSPPPTTAPLTHLPVRELHANPANIRTELEDVTGLADTIRTHGVLQPLLVTRSPTRQWLILDGHRRLAAAHLAGLDQVPVTVRGRTSLEEALEVMLVTGLQKADLHPLDEAHAYGQLLELGYTQADMAKAVGKHQGQISQRLALLNLTPDEQHALRQRQMTTDQAYRVGRERGPRKMPTGQRRPKPMYVPHFTSRHPLAEHARARCSDAGHATSLKLGPACGACWEQTIRDDTRGELPTLRQAPPCPQKHCQARRRPHRRPARLRRST